MALIHFVGIERIICGLFSLPEAIAKWTQNRANLRPVLDFTLSKLFDLKKKRNCLEHKFKKSLAPVPPTKVFENIS